MALADWAEHHGIKLEFTKPGTPTQNSYVERFKRTYPDELLNMYVFRNLTEVLELNESWMTEYNDERPHDSLEELTPWEYLAKHQRAENSNQRCN
jgi:putative transposase